MEKYRLYKFTLKPSHMREGDWTQSEVAEPADLSKAQETFEKLLKDTFKEGRRLPIGKETDTGDKVLPNTIMRNHERVTLLRLNNPENINIYKEDGSAIPQESLPLSYIIIDNRQGIGQIAIQMKTEAWTNPDTVAGLLEGNLNRILKDQRTGLEIEIRHKWLPTEFFEHVKKYRKENNVTVDHLSFEFTNPEFETPIETAVETSGHLKQLMNMLSQLGGAKCKMQIDAPRKKELIKRKLKDIKQIVSLVASNGYNLKVTFSDKSTYTCNEGILADFDMAENVISNFKDGWKHALFEFELFRWLDEKRQETKDYKDDEQPIRRKPARKNRNLVS